MATSPPSLSIAYLGPPASYTHQAARALAPLNPSTPLHLAPVATIPALFHAIQSRTHAYALCPLENSSNGPVTTTLDLLAATARTHPAVAILGERRVRVAHCLVVRARPTSPPASPPPRFPDLPPAVQQRLQRLDALTTHPQAWTQCTRFLAHLDAARAAAGRPPARRVDASSTSGAALGLVADVEHEAPTPPRRASLFEGLVALWPGARGGDEEETAAISSSLAAEGNAQLEVLVAGLEDRADNVTRFLVLGRREEGAGLRTVGREAAGCKALVTFTLGRVADGAATRTDPGALARALAVFERRRLNLSSIAARPSGRAAWDYTFVVEVEVGEQEQEGMEGAVRAAVDEVRGVAGGEASLVGVWAWDGSV